MAGTTDHYGLSKLNTGDHLSDNDYKHVDGDRDTIDTVLYQGAQGHHHTGEAGSIEEPDLAPELTLDTEGGTIPAGTRVYYKYTYVNSLGQSLSSPEAFIDTPNAVEEPASPTLSYTSTGGILQGGNYYYVLTSYVAASINESKAINRAFITIPATTATNEITLTLPSDSDGQTGFNVYRRKPGQTKYFFLDTVPTDVATPPTTYVDDGSVEEDCDRTLPKANTTNSTNSIQVTLPGATPTVPEGYTWKIYRTYINGVWDSSLLAWVVENISEGSEVITPTYLDIGISTSSGTFPLTSLLVGNPDRVLLTDMEEVQGTLPMGAMAFPFPLTFQFPGNLSVVQGSTTWVCPFPNAEVVWAQANLGRGCVPAAEDVIVDVNYAASSATPSFTTMYTTQANRPRIEVGQQVGIQTSPDITLLERDDCITVDIDQIGDGATPTDRDLCVTIYIIAYGFPLTSYVAGETGGAGGEF